MTENKLKSKTEKFLHKASEIHGQTYDYSESTYEGCKRKIIIKCKIHGKFLQLPLHHLGGQGCPKCGWKMTGEALSSNTPKFVQKAKKIHGNKYDYSKSIYTGVHKKMIIVCPVHGEFAQTPNNHLNGNGCLYCVKNYKLTLNGFIERARHVHGDKYNYSRVIFINTRTPIEIVCPIHGSFHKTPNAHLNGNGCRQCWKERISLERRSNTDVFIRKSIATHGQEYDYSNSKYETNHKNIEIICKWHGSFFQRPIVHIRGSRCPKCHSSLGEAKILKFLNDKKIDYISEKRFDGCRNPKTNATLKFDFYIPSKNLLIEYDGAQHFMYGCNLGYFITTKKDMNGVKFRDRIKTEYARTQGIRLLRIPYTEFSKIDEILKLQLSI